MPRYRETDTRWLRAACVAGGYLVGVATLFTLQVGAAVVLPISVAVGTPPLLYAALSMVVVRHAPLARRISWIGSACLSHVLLGVLAAVELMWAGGLPPVAALAQVFVLFAPAPALTLMATLIVVALCGAPTRPATRVDSPAPRRPATPAARHPRSFAHAAGVDKGEADWRSPPVPAVFGAASTAAVARAAPPAAPAAVVPPSPAPAAPALEPPVTSPPVSEVRARQAPRVSRRDDAMVRVSFERVAAQLPAEAFVLPFDRLAESLKEPHALLVPQRIVLARMREEGIAIDWATVAGQFPELALGMSEADFRYRYPDLRLWLPVDEVLAQLPPDAIPLASAVLDTEPLAVPPLAIAVAPPAGPDFVVPPAVAVAPPAEPVPPPWSPAVAWPVVAVPPTAAGVEPRSELLDRQALTRIVACFSGVGPFEAAAERVGAITLIALVEPSLPRGAVVACAAGVVRFLTEGAGEVITLRTTRSIIVLAAGAVPVLVAAPRPGAPVALLELRTARAALANGDGGVAAQASASPTLQPVAVDGRVTSAGQALRSFGAVEPTVFSDGDARVYVFSTRGRDATPLGGLALTVCQTLGDGGGELGRVVSVVLRRGGERILVRPLAGAAVLAAAGAVTCPGRAHRDADRAAAVLEAL